MLERGGRLVAARFESSGGEVAACLSTVGLCDRCDRATLELRGAPDPVSEALADLDWIAERTWWARLGPGRAIARCERGDALACSAALRRSPDASVLDRSGDFAAVGVIGPRANELMQITSDGDFGSEVIVVREAADRFEALASVERGPLLWYRLLAGGGPLQAACVGSDALVQLAAARRLGPGSPRASTGGRRGG